MLQSHPSHPVGPQMVKARITAATVCAPHGSVVAGQVVTVTIDEFWQLKHAGKAELAPVEVVPAAKPDDELVTVDELREQLEQKTKAELVAGAKEMYGLALAESAKKETLIAAILAAAEQEGK